ncbi:hypothetical protein, conserved [Plasmodium gonderi]|uniref:RNA-editing substrate-binding complex 6 protein domain-containing protein n=1 Tax=Plasmodium gonderi TaxID=77519 RepID=A0A1Y1JI93_PLAGO|nr:hypothetical protein, conserved [Plasmodium gonderi]GAW80522.1 hypothetical protein, conserved [Plasmodium gonderi]
MKDILMKNILEKNLAAKNLFRKNGTLKRLYCQAAEKSIKEDKTDSIINYKMVLGLKKIDISNLSSLCRDFHNIFRIDKYQLLKYTNDILPFVKYLRTSEIVMILHHYAFINYHNFHFYDNVWNQIIDKLHDIDCKELALIIYSMGKIKYVNNDMISFFEKEIKNWVTRFTGRDCSLILKGMKCLNYNNEQIYSLIYDRILAISDNLNILDICIILNTHSKSKNINLHLFETLLQKSLTFYSVLNEQCIGSLLWSVSNANIKSEKYFSLLALRLRLLMHAKYVKEGKLVQSDSFGEHCSNETNIISPDRNVRSDNKLPDESKKGFLKNENHINDRISSDDMNYEDEKINSSGNLVNLEDDLIENNIEPEGRSMANDISNHLDNLNFRLTSPTACKYENVIPSIIYSYGKQKTYMKHNIYVDKNLYNHIVNSYNVECGINNSPQETVYLFDISRKFLKDKNIFDNIKDNHKKNKLRKYQNKKFYQDIIYIINNYLPFFLSNIHYNDLKNVLFGIAKIEMSLNKKVLNDIFELIVIYVKRNLYKSYEIINLSRSLSLLPHVKPDLWICILDCYKNNFISNTSVKNNCYLFYIFSFVKKGLGNSNFHLHLIQHINEKVTHFCKDDIIHLIKGLINLHYYHNELVKNISNFVQKNYELFNLIDIVYILKYFTSMSLRDENVFSLFALTIKKHNTRCNYEVISTIASFYLEMDITPKAIKDILMEERKSREKIFTTEEIHCDDE